MAKRKILLIADDDVDFTEILSERLEHSGYETVSVHEGIRVIEAANKHSPDLIILDWKMPAGMGSTVLIELKKKGNTRHIPVIVLTGLDDENVEKEALRLGAKAFMKKPYDTHMLLQKIHEVLELRSLEESLEV